MNAPHTFAKVPRGFGRRTVSIAEIRARAARRAATREACRDLLLLIVLPFLAASSIIYFGGL